MENDDLLKCCASQKEHIKNELSKKNLIIETLKKEVISLKKNLKDNYD